MLADEPGEDLIDQLAAVFLDRRDGGDQIAQVVHALVGDPAFAAPPAELRHPFEYLAALYRATGAEVAAPENAFHDHLAEAGWHQHTHVSPDGHLDRTEDWSNGTVLLRTIGFALHAHEDWFGCTTSRLSDALPDWPMTFGEVAAFWAWRFGGEGASSAPEVWDLWDAKATDPAPGDPDGRDDVSSVAVAMAAISPRFLLR